MSNWPPTDESFSKDDLMEAVLNRAADIEAVGEETAEIAVDATLSYVVDWLHERGNIDVAAMLAHLTGVDE